jgi:hypothetical protein
VVLDGLVVEVVDDVDEVLVEVDVDVEVVVEVEVDVDVEVVGAVVVVWARALVNGKTTKLMSRVMTTASTGIRVRALPKGALIFHLPP